MLKKLLFASTGLFLCASVSHANPPMTISVAIQGIEPTLAQALQADLALPYLHPDPAISESTLDFYTDQGLEDITLALQAIGFYSPNITVQKSFSNNRWLITYQVDKGPPVVIESIHFDLEGPGKHHPQLTNLQQSITLEPNTALSHEAYEDNKSKLLNQVIFEGYLDAEYVTHRIEITSKNNRANIYLVLDTGPLYFFGPTSFTSSALRLSFLKRFLPYCPGDPFSAQTLLQLENHLRQSDYFSDVKVDSEPNHQTRRVPILVQLTDQKPNHYLFGVGYGTDTGARGKVGYLRRRVNSFGHRFRSEVKVSQLSEEIEAEYLVPGKHPQTDHISLFTQYSQEEYNEKPVDSLKITLSEKRDLYGWDRTIGLSFLREKSITYVTNDTRRDQLLIPYLELRKTESDNPSNPRRGKTRLMRLKGAHKQLGGDVSFIQASFLQRWLHTFDNEFKALFRFELGATLPRYEDELPLSQRFFAGGDNSMRGFSYRSLPAEIDKDGVPQPVGGSYLAIGSLEVAKPIYGDLGIHSFIDFGNAFRNSTDDVQIGIGAGLSYNTPFGPIKVSFAKPITNAANAWHIHASFGPEI